MPHNAPAPSLHTKATGILVPQTYSGEATERMLIRQFERYGRRLMHNKMAEVHMVCSSRPQESALRRDKPPYVPIGPWHDRSGWVRVLNRKGKLLNRDGNEMPSNAVEKDWYNGKTLLERMLRPRDNVVFVLLY